MSIDGILNVNKPAGNTSFSIVALLRWLSGEKHIGHAGTLDPIATGVLPVCLGRATRVVQFLSDNNKTYLAQIELGVTTDTYDREGTIIDRSNPSGVNAAKIEKVLTNFQGTIEQLPPIYSALKYRGKRYYELARAGIHVETKPRQVKIITIQLIDCELPYATIRVECSKGTYIRSLAHDLGQYLGCGACLMNLTRLQYGPFHIKDALSVSQVKCIFHQGLWEKFIYPVDTPLLSWSAVIVDKTGEVAIKNGCSISIQRKYGINEQYCRAYNPDGRFIAVLRFIPEKDLWHPDKVFPFE